MRADRAPWAGGPGPRMGGEEKGNHRTGPHTLPIPRPWEPSWPFPLGLQSLKSEQTGLSLQVNLDLAFWCRSKWEQEQPGFSVLDTRVETQQLFCSYYQAQGWGLTRSLATLSATSNPLKERG